jgi:hypothetical protein
MFLENYDVRLHAVQEAVSTDTAKMRKCKLAPVKSHSDQRRKSGSKFRRFVDLARMGDCMMADGVH